MNSPAPKQNSIANTIDQTEFTDTKQQAELLKDWDCWVSIMRRLEKRRTPRISKNQYQKLLHRISKRCQTETKHQILQESIFTIVAPWVSLDAISQADRRVLQEILSECDQLNHTIRGVGFKLTRKVRQFILLLSFISIAVVATIRFDQLHQKIYIWSAQFSRRVYYALSELNAEQSLAVLTVFVVIGGVWLTRQTRNF